MKEDVVRKIRGHDKDLKNQLIVTRDPFHCNVDLLLMMSLH